MKKFLFLFLFAFTLWACGKNETVEADQTHEAHAAAEDGAIHLTAAQATQAGLEFGSFTQKNLSDELRVNAELAVHQEHIAEVTAFSDGILSGLNTTLNASVRKGQVLATVRKPDLLDLQQQFLENRDRLVFLQTEYDRYRSLKDADATALKNFQKAAADLQAAKTASQLLAAKLFQYQIDPDKLTPSNLRTQLVLTAPVSGLVTAIHSNVGAAVLPGTPVCEVTDLSQLHADLWVYEKDILKVKNGQRVRLAFPAEPSKTYPAAIYSIDKVLDPEKRAVRVHARLEGNPGGQVNFVNGAYLEARIATSGGGETNALPEEAVVREGDEDFIFILEKEDAGGSFFKKIKVTKGSEEAGFVAVQPVEPLPQGAKIVVKGAYYVSAQAASIEAGHEH
jgi:membrane fusion protein, heavy metal efflux system